MRIEIWGKAGCGKCEAAKEKLARFGVAYEWGDLGAPGDDWRQTGAALALAWSTFHAGELPVVVIDGEPMGYPEAMKRLKGKERKADHEAEAKAQT